MQARISTIEGDAGKIDDAVKIINEKILPALIRSTQGLLVECNVAKKTGRPAAFGILATQTCQFEI